MCSLKHHKFIILQFWTSKDQNRSCWAKIRLSEGWVLSPGLRENLFLCLLWFLEFACILCLLVFFFHLQSLQHQPSPYHSAICIGSLLSPFSLFMDHCDYIGFTFLFQGNLPIKIHFMGNLNSIWYLNSPLSCKLTYQFQELGHRPIFLGEVGGHYSAYDNDYLWY